MQHCAQFEAICKGLRRLFHAAVGDEEGEADKGGLRMKELGRKRMKRG